MTQPGEGFTQLPIEGNPAGAKVRLLVFNVPQPDGTTQLVAVEGSFLIDPATGSAMSAMTRGQAERMIELQEETVALLKKIAKET